LGFLEVACNKMRQVFYILLVILIVSCNKPHNIRNPSSVEFCDSISDYDIEAFQLFDYNERMKWTFKDTIFAQWYYHEDIDAIVIAFGFNKINKLLNLPYRFDDSLIVTFMPIDNGNITIRAHADREYSASDFLDTIYFNESQINPYRYFKNIDKKRNTLGIIDIRNSRVNNVIGFYISRNDILIYIPDSLESNYGLKKDSTFMDSLSLRYVNKIKTNTKLIKHGWYYNYDEKGVDY
jgi:hypothetical protein